MQLQFLSDQLGLRAEELERNMALKKLMDDEMWTKRSALMMWTAGFMRLLLVVYAEWHDAHLEVPYTDIDYYVFSDAAALIHLGKSPFDRATYRYTPLLALVLLPNSTLHRCWGKLLFSFADLIVALLIRKILNLRGVSERQCFISAATWLFNPFTFTVGTRGNCEALVCAMILWLLLCIMSGRVIQAAFWFGVVVHVRIYPIIYVLPVLLLLDGDYVKMVAKGSSNDPGASSRLKHSLRSFFNWPRVVFGAVSGSVFFALCGLFYFIYGTQYLHEALFYHLTRSDHRHNFSIYFYSIYLNDDVGLTLAQRLLAFVPQMSVQLVLVAFFAKDLPFCFFLQTVAFVTFNKVITAQYFVWFFCLLPLILPFTSLKLRWGGAALMSVWTGAQVHWLGWAYLLEFRGKNTFLPLWVASIVFFAANIVVMVTIIRHHSFCPMFQGGVLSYARLKSRRIKGE
ncbi:GPI mannosyltransferase 1 subunit M [Marchantia polymorpha subsp. ruderalis]|uniref:GPI mannosyltransferase 1 n=2 Tax=Marchantia polymorpha TaxID=3197 RepID=A0A176WDR8_MARPO|nr:hypothetical protein AXG93_1842s1020 [Marchantia polymorpha subsp. ruderalis]PTQ34490.1 hypothetical protein MARPO_0079s0001 [Marchantia polymorpha]BBN20063.1 hypothetical protein Mp_8g16130 [Marchantia polymorpha subsp. ruderalis]|eukprot:PTQ34490.1 hypothetical protein MARPO_0079s0001 [Marchantia polymorpha]